MSLRYTPGRFVFNFIKLEREMTSLWRHLSFLQTIVHISNSIKPTNFVLGTNTQQYNVHLMIKMKVTLTDNEGHRRRSKVTKTNLWSYIANYYTYRDHTWYQGTIQQAASNDISLFDLDVRSRSQLKVKDVEVSALSECFLFLFFNNENWHLKEERAIEMTFMNSV